MVTRQRSLAAKQSLRKGKTVGSNPTAGSKYMKPLTGKYDKSNALLTVYAGAGGDDAKEWADMLTRMYIRYSETRGWKVSAADNRSIEIKGDYVYGSLRKEAGVHRLVRISPFSAKKLRHTSFALVEIVPIFPDVDYLKLVIPQEDLKIDAFRSSGPGGQNVNKRETAVRVTHLPTGLSVASQVERSQQQNREKAEKLLKSKLIKLMEEKQAGELSALRTKITPEWGNQIRSYVLHPYQQVKDHRTGAVSQRPEDVLNGNLDKFIEAELELT